MSVDPGPVGSFRLAPSILSADFGHLARAVAAIDDATDWLHLDVMDGHFVPNISLGAPVVASLRPYSSRFFDCHLMIDEPSRYAPDFARAGADGCTFHVEVGDTATHIRTLRELGLRVGLSLSPETPFEAVAPFLDAIDTLLVMSVHPGFGGQSFIGDVLAKVAAARALVDERGLSLDIEIDGGIDLETAPLAVVAGANVLVAGSAIFSRDDPLGAARALRAAAGDR